MKRYKHLVDNDEAYDWLNKAFKYRRNYLHSLGGLKDTITWRDMTQARWSLTQAVDRYLEIATRCQDLNREELLGSLEATALLELP